MMLCGRPIGPDQPLFLIAGPCVIESEAMTLAIADHLAGVAGRMGVLLVFKASFDKANRSSDASFRGLGMEEGLRILEKIEAVGYDVFRRRPVLGRGDWPRLAWRALRHPGTNS